MSKKKKGAIITLVVVVICLLGVLAFAVGKKMTTKNNSQTAPRVVNEVQPKKSEVQKKSANGASNGLENNLDDTDYYVLATIKGFNMNPPHVQISLNSLNQDAQKWTVQGDCFRLGQQNDGKMGVIPNGNGAGYEFISIDKDSVTVAHMGGGKDDADNHWISQTFSKKELVNEYLKSTNDVNLLKQTVSSLNKNNDTYKASVAQQKSEENVDTTNLTTEQLENWVFRSVMQDLNNEPGQTLKLTPNDQDAFDYMISTDDDGCVEVNVKQNPNSAYFKKSKMDPTSTYSFGIYRVNGKGELQKMNDTRTKWKTVSNTFADPVENQ